MIAGDTAGVFVVEDPMINGEENINYWGMSFGMSRKNRSLHQYSLLSNLEGISVCLVGSKHVCC